MSELRDVLSSRQLVKHHELLHYLSQRPNVKFTLAQLDYLLPSGASLQHFPPEWIELMREGRCGSRNLEILRPGEEEDDRDERVLKRVKEESSEEDGKAMGLPLLDPNTVLLCRQPAIRSIAELATLLETPATVPDTEGCAALHTSQVRLPESILREAQRRGLAFYFSEALQAKATASVARARGNVAAGGGEGPSSASIHDAASAKGDALLSAALTGGMGVPSTVVRLPPGVRVRYKLLTRRGITAQDEHCLPVRLHLGERLQITLDDEGAARHCISCAADAGPRTALMPHLEVSFRMISPVIRQQKDMEDNPPLRIRVKAAPAVSSSSSPNAIGFTRITLSVEAARAEKFRLALRVRSKHRFSNGGTEAEALEEEVLLDYEVRDVDTLQPGVLIGCERQPSSFSLPPEYTLADPAVHGKGIDPAVDTAPARAARILPWWQSGSPSCSLVRDATFPLEDGIQAAIPLVFTRRALHHEDKLKAAKKLVRMQQQQQQQRGVVSSGIGKDAKDNYKIYQRLRNRHLLHFGLDASVPFVPRKM